LLQTRLPAPTDDEFGAWAESFNRMAAALEEKIEALSDAAERERRFTADVAHELRTPLTGMSSAASMLADELDGIRPQGHRLAEILIDDVRRLEDLVLEQLASTPARTTSTWSPCRSPRPWARCWRPGTGTRRSVKPLGPTLPFSPTASGSSACSATW
ncbi:MAG TPA: histidine kinase dimerization/phospho-acceptor domain-containing protein, partial [Acidimicrobiales bacterium]|nr:histidine kinase dimerization/phospho-acceptor domain-containing protein [Acidimicrobiales bacterium]